MRLAYHNVHTDRQHLEKTFTLHHADRRPSLQVL
jgi:hypothetical protein